MMLGEQGRTMSANDLMHLEANFRQWNEGRGKHLRGVAPFTYYCIENFLRTYAIDDNEIQGGITDGSHDGGVDAFYFFINGKYVTEDAVFDQKTGDTPSVSLIVFQIKESESGFSPVEINKLSLFGVDLLNVSDRDEAVLSERYRPKLLSLMRVFWEKYESIAGQLPSVKFEFFYITRGDDLKPNTQAENAITRLKGHISQVSSRATTEVYCVNAQKLLKQVEKRPATSYKFKFEVTPMASPEGYVGTVLLQDFYELLKDENGQLSQRLFESNVRGWQQYTAVNTKIRETLKKPEPNFWLLNNGITILCSAAGSPGGYLEVVVQDPQIVNGLQTSRAIFEHFRELENMRGKGFPADQVDKRSVLVRIIRSTDAAVYDEIVRATNSQNKMAPASLRATDQIHRQIEVFFQDYGLFYDRRKGHYKDEGKPANQIIAISELLQAVVSIVLRRPDEARARPGNYITNEGKYKQVFSPSRLNLTVYLNCIQISRKVDEVLASDIEDRGERVNLKFYTIYVVGCIMTTRVDPSPKDIQRIKLERVTTELIRRSVEIARTCYKKHGGTDVAAKGTEMLVSVREQLPTHFVDVD